jgi:hypothetical protein
MYSRDPSSRTPGNALLTGLGALPLVPGMTVYHGSPHKFDKFDSSKIGTGEGAQAYGHGLYVAEDPKVAVGYRKNLSFKEIVKQFRSELPDNANVDEVMELLEAGQLPKGVSAVVKALRDDDWLGFDYPSQAINAAFGKLDDFDASPELRKAVKDYGGHLYNVDLPDEHIEKMLDWDAPLSEQSESVKAAIQKVVRDNGITPENISQVSGKEGTGGDFYRVLSSTRSIRKAGGYGTDQDAASLMLKNLGIPGIKYLDGSSRSQGKGTRNFVVFDDKLLKIVEKE